MIKRPEICCFCMSFAMMYVLDVTVDDVDVDGMHRLGKGRKIKQDLCW